MNYTDIYAQVGRMFAKKMKENKMKDGWVYDGNPILMPSGSLVEFPYNSDRFFERNHLYKSCEYCGMLNDLIEPEELCCRCCGAALPLEQRE